MATENEQITLRAALPGPLDPAPSRGRAGRDRSADVVVIGAGLAGLVAARRIVAGGRSVVVLEARQDRVGGRVESATHHGHAVDLGGAWIGRSHGRAAALARELGAATWPSRTGGEPVVVNHGKRMRGRGYKLRHIAATLDGRRAVRRLDRLASTVRTDRPWETEDADALDSQTLGSWLDAATRLRRSRATASGK